MATSVLFLCPHNAAKSITAAAYFRRLAAESAIEVEISTGGTDPDEAVLPLVRTQLETDGYVVNDVPRLVTSGDLDGADVIINIGCQHADLATSNDIIDWGIPNFSEDPAAAFCAISEHVGELVESLQNGNLSAS